MEGTHIRGDVTQSHNACFDCILLIFLLQICTVCNEIVILLPGSLIQYSKWPPPLAY